MPFYNPRGELNPLPHARTFGEESRMALLAMDCILNGEKAVYASSELTTGPRLYRLLRERGLKDTAALKAALGEEEFQRLIWDPNAAEADAFARELRSRIPGRPMVVTPAPFLAPGWQQEEYLAFWETAIRTRFNALYFSDDWEWSNGCTFEFAVAWDAGLSTYTAAGQVLSLEDGVALIVRAAEALEAEGFDASGLRQNLARLPRRSSSR